MKEVKEVKEVIGVNKEELVSILKAVKSPVPATVTTMSVAKMNKRNNPYLDKVIKKSVSNIFLNYSYQNAVNKRLLKEGKEANFVSKPRVWGVRVEGTPLVEHKDTYYVSLGYLTNNKSKTEYTMNGEPIDKSLFEEFLIKKTPSKTQGLEDEVEVRDVMVDNIFELRLNGNIYQRNDI